MNPVDPRVATPAPAGVAAPWASAGGAARELLARRIVPTLHAQRWSLDGAGAGALARAVHLSAGRGTLGHGDGELTLRAGDLAWLPGGEARQLQVEAGSAGVTVGVSDALLAGALGAHADAAPLRAGAARRCLVSAAEPGPRDELLRSLLALDAESRQPGGVSRPYLAAHLTLVLVTLWRLSSHDAGHASAAAALAGAPGLSGGSIGARHLLRFRHLVEAQFRARWTVARYAAELGLSPDRLHDLCAQQLGRSPLVLVHQRMVREACALLAGTEHSVERIAGALGFSSASHFSRLFKRWLAVSPQGWRRQARRGAGSGSAALPASYADWP
jgi:AraC family transcriptional activator of pobA